MVILDRVGHIKKSMGRPRTSLSTKHTIFCQVFLLESPNLSERQQMGIFFCLCLLNNLKSNKHITYLFQVQDCKWGEWEEWDDCPKSCGNGGLQLQERFREKIQEKISTGKSFSEALILASTNPQYDDRLFIELRVQYFQAQNMLCT